MVHGYVVIQKKGGGDGPLYPVHGNIKIGRGTHCGIRVHVQSVSEEHSLISVGRGKRAQIQNLSSSSVTLVNGVSAGTAEVSLQHGDIITVGERAFRWMYPDDSPYFRKNEVSIKRRKSLEVGKPGSFRIAVQHKRHTCGALFPPSGLPFKSAQSQIVQDLKSVEQDSASVAKLKGTPPDNKRSKKKSLRTPRSTSKANTPSATKTSLTSDSESSKRMSRASSNNCKGQTPKAPKIPKTPSSLTIRSVPSKRKLSSPRASEPKRMKIESPKTIDKKKMAALIGIHRKSPWVAASPSRKSKVATLSSSKPRRASQTPNQKATTTPGGSARKVPAWGAPSSRRRPLFSEVLKKAKQRVKVVKRAPLLPPSKSSKVASKKQSAKTFIQEIPKSFQFNSTGHANSPEPIFIRRKAAVTPAPTRKGRKEPVLLLKSTKTDAVDLVGLDTLFKTPLKTVLATSPLKSSTKAADLKKGVPKDASQTPKEGAKSARRSSAAVQKNVLLESPKACVLPSAQKAVSSSKMENLGNHLRPSTRSKSLGNFDQVDTELSSLRGNRSRHSLAHHHLVKSTMNSPKPLLNQQIIDKSGLDGEITSSHKRGLSDSDVEKQLQSPMSSLKSACVMTPLSPQKTPTKSSLKCSPCGDSPTRGKALSVSFDDSVHFQNEASDSDCQSFCATPDATFDFNTVKTPNVPSEMFVSSIFSSGSLSSRSSAGSAKRKGMSSSGSGGLRGIRRLMKSPVSPVGYVDVRGIKRLMASPCKTPTYLAVEGVKKLFEDAALSAQNSLSSFVGVKELFSSPSPLKAKSGGRPQARNSENAAGLKPSCVAKIMAEVEGKMTPNFTSAKTSKKTPVGSVTRTSTSMSSQEVEVSNITSSCAPESSSNSNVQVTQSPPTLLSEKVSSHGKISCVRSSPSIDFGSGSGRMTRRRAKQTKLCVENTSFVNSSPISSTKMTKRKTATPLVSPTIADVKKVKSKTNKPEGSSMDTVKPPKEGEVKRTTRKAASSAVSALVECKASPAADAGKEQRSTSSPTELSSVSATSSSGRGEKRAKRKVRSSHTSPTVVSKSSPIRRARRVKGEPPSADVASTENTLLPSGERLKRDKKNALMSSPVIQIEDTGKAPVTRVLRRRGATKTLSPTIKSSVDDAVAPVTSRPRRGAHVEISGSVPSKKKQVTFSQEEVPARRRKRSDTDLQKVDETAVPDTKRTRRGDVDLPEESTKTSKNNKKQTSSHDQKKSKSSVKKSTKTVPKVELSVSPRRTRSSRK